MVRFTPANSKLKKLYKVRELQRWLVKRKIYKFDLRAGHSCPFAKDCLSKVVNGKVVDGPDTQFRCYAASLEALYAQSYALHLANEIALKTASISSRMFKLLEAALPKNAGIVRFHTSGDFFNVPYFRAWLQLANNHPDVLFYGYTKNNFAWVKNINAIPPNFVLTASLGGKLDHLIDSHNLRSARVVYSVGEADSLGLEIDDNDSHAAVPEWRNDDFALLIHGVQPKGSNASRALAVLNG